MTKCDVAIVGAGPYGLSATRHLRTIKGLEVRVFGEPMSFWNETMPEGMFLRSNWTATQIADPQQTLTLEQFQADTRCSFSTPVPLDRFVEYGLWYQRKGVPDVERRQVVRVEPDPYGFRVTLSDGETFLSRRVVIAAGIGTFPRLPAEFANVPCALASHTSGHHDFRPFAGKEILIIGSGQSALESAALLYEAGAQVEVFGRSDHINWLGGFASQALHKRLGGLVRNLLYAPTDVGPAVLSQLCARPGLVKLLPRYWQDRLRKRAVRPAGARWLVDRLKPVSIHLGRTVVSATPVGERIAVKFDDGAERTVDHVFLGTGFQVNISKYNFLAPQLVDSIARSNGFPKLRPGLETSVAGLHIVGAPAAWSFGPLMQFVSGAGYASRSLLRSIGSKSSHS